MSPKTGALRACLQEGDGAAPRSISGCGLMARVVPQKVFNLQFVPFLDDLIKQSAQRVFDDFCSNLYLGGSKVRLAPPASKAPDTLDDVLVASEQFFDKTALADALKVVAKVFSSSGKKDVEWPCDAPLDLLRQLFEVLASASDKTAIYFRCLCGEGVANAPVATLCFCASLILLRDP